MRQIWRLPLILAALLAACPVLAQQITYPGVSGLPAPMVDVRTCGAVGDGVADDTAAIQACINNAALLVGGSLLGQLPVSLPALGSQATTVYTFTNLIVPPGTRLVGGGSHRTLLQVRAGASGCAISDNGANAAKIRIEGIQLLGNGVAGDGICLLGNSGSAPWGSEGSLDDVAVSGFTTGTGIRVHANASFMRYVRVLASAVGFDIRGGALLGSQLIASNNTTNFRIVGTGHQLQQVYSESAVTTHFQFGDGLTTTTRNVIDGLQVHLRGSATTPSIVSVQAAGSNVQLNTVANATYDFGAGAVLTSVIADASTGVTIAPLYTNNTVQGTFDYRPDQRGANVKVLVEADFVAGSYTLARYTPFTTFAVEGIAAARVINLPTATFSYGRVYAFRNNASFRVRLVAAGATLYPPLSTGLITNYDLPPGNSVIIAADLNGHWQAYGEAPTMQGSDTWDPPNLASGASAIKTITVTDSIIGDFVDVSFGVSLAGLQLTGYVSVNGTVTAVLSNLTGAPVDLPSSTVRARGRRQ